MGNIERLIWYYVDFNKDDMAFDIIDACELLGIELNLFGGKHNGNYGN